MGSVRFVTTKSSDSQDCAHLRPGLKSRGPVSKGFLNLPPPPKGLRLGPNDYWPQTSLCATLRPLGAGRRRRRRCSLGVHWRVLGSVDQLKPSWCLQLPAPQPPP